MISQNFIKLYEQSFKDNWDLSAYSDYGESTHYTFGEVAQEIAKLHLLFEHCKINKGDKIGLIGKNNARWCISYLATITYGAIIVPILQDFNPNDIQHIVNHSESKLLFVGDSIWEQINEQNMEMLIGAISLTDYSCLYSIEDEEHCNNFQRNIDQAFKQRYSQGFRKNDLQYAHVDNSEMILLNYTSGTTGFTKGVMLSANNLAGNVTFGIQTELMHRGGRVLSFLPLAHAYGCAFDFLTAAAVGTHVTLLGKIPSPKILVKALEEVRPELIIAVPLVIEKIYKNMIMPMLKKRYMKVVIQIPVLDRRIYATIRKKLIRSFGGEFSQIILGGAALNQEVEEFFRKIKFPFTVGYGMTECGPLISYTRFDKFKPNSSGKILDCMQVRIDSVDPYSQIGEIQVKGENVMLGYYKNEEATRDVFTEDGWLKTGDLGTIDHDNTIYIRGRSKTMILSSSGQNIFPEQIEAKMNNLPYVGESLIVENRGKLIALVYPDYAAADQMKLSADDLPAIMEENRKQLNSMTASYEQISAVRLYPNEFVKTPKRSIKRYLYNSIAE